MNEILANPEHPRYLGGYVRLGTAYATEDYRRAPEAFRTGSTVPFQGRSEDFARTVAEAIAGMNRVVARRILPSLSGVVEQLNRGGALLEVGCGTGNLLLQLAQAFPHSRCTGVDIDPTGLTAAREAVHQAGLTERVQLLEGAVSQAVLPEAYDVVVMVEVLHEISPPLRPGVIQGCARALRAGGWLVIVDETYPATLVEARRSEFLFPVQTGFEELLWGNVVPTNAEQEQLLHAAGFTGAINRALMGEGFTLLTTQK